MVESLSGSIENYESATRWVYDRIDYERVRPRRKSAHFRLERVEKLLALIGSPQLRIPAIHIAGTKGKGSTSAILDSILRESGIRTGLFTSPHIEVFEERMRVDGAMPEPDQLVAMVGDLQRVLDDADPEIVDAGVTYFEVATLLAWMYFDRQNAAVAVLETGLGGRLDCTNVCRPVLTIITTIGLDHTHILGDTLPKIAAEKAGIMKDSVPLLTSVVNPEVLAVFQEHAERLDCNVHRRGVDILVDHRNPDGTNGNSQFHVRTPWGRHEDLTLSLHGRHQRENASLAVAAADCLKQHVDSVGWTWPEFASACCGINAATIREGVASVDWPLRFQVIPGAPEIILDAAHNPDSIHAFLETLAEFESSRRRRVLIFASSGDKDADTMLKKLSGQFDDVILTQFESNPRAIPPGKLMAMAVERKLTCRDDGQFREASNPDNALHLARRLSGNSGVICGTGSIFIAAELWSLVAS